MVHSIEVKDQARQCAESIKRSKQTTDVSKVVKDIVDDSLNNKAVFVQLEYYAS